MINLLPSSSLVPFEVRKLSRSKVIWSANADNHDIDERFSYAIPGKFDSPDNYADLGKTYYGERYGGADIVNNGGGVRCGYCQESGFQIKGIGKNPLGGKSPDFWYSHGGATLEEAIREAVWGEVCTAALPYGGVRVHAIIASGNVVAFNSPAGRIEVPGALIVRDAAIRPAHYMRATYYQPDEFMVKHHLPDVERTRCAILKLSAGFRSILGEEAPADPDADYLNAGFRELAKRIAHQLAGARTSKIVHGALSCSNIALDGRFLDYGTITSVADYRRIIVARGQPDMLSEHTKSIYTLSSLLFYCRKFSPAGIKEKLIERDALVEFFSSLLAERVNMGLLRLTGIPEHALLGIDAGLRAEAVKLFQDIIAAGDCEPFKFKTDEMDEPMGAYHLNSILQTAALCNTPQQMDRELDAALSGIALRDRFIAIFWKLREAYLRERPDPERKRAGLFMAVNGFRLNCSIPELYRPNLARRIESILENDSIEEDAAMLIAGFSKKAKTLFSFLPGNVIDLFAWSQKKLQLDESRGAMLDGTPITLTRFPGFIHDDVISNNQRMMLAALCE